MPDGRPALCWLTQACERKMAAYPQRWGLGWSQLPTKHRPTEMPGRLSTGGICLMVLRQKGLATDQASDENPARVNRDMETKSPLLPGTLFNPGCT